MTKVLVSGCSFTEGYDWPQYLYENSSVTNLGRSGSSNRFICHSVASAVTKNDYDEIFILFTGFSKLDVIVPSTSHTKKIAQEWKYYGEVDDMLYIFDGGNRATLVANYIQIKDESWPDIVSVDQFFQLPSWIKNECIQHGLISGYNPQDLQSIIFMTTLLHQLGDRSHNHNVSTLQSMAFLTALLDKKKKNYWFAFALDPFKKNIQGKINRKNIYYHEINWSRYIDINPFEFCIKNDTMNTDNGHPSKQGMRVWAKAIQKVINDKTISVTQ